LLDPSNTAVSVSNVAAAINEAIAYWKFRRFWFNTVNDSATLTAQNPIIPIPSDFLVELPMNDGFVVSYSNMRYPLIKVNPKDFDDVYLDNGYGLPRRYTLKAGVYYCYFIPDQNYTVLRWYLKDYSDLVNSSDTNDFTTYAAQLITYWASSKLHAELRQDEKMEAYYSARALDEYKNLQVRNEKANSTGHLTLHTFL
jgi:hypothetical protein